MATYEEMKNWVLSQKDNITRKNFSSYMDYLKENYFKIETAETSKEKFQHSLELINLSLRFCGSWESGGAKYTKVLLLPSSNIEKIDFKFNINNVALLNLLGFTWEDGKDRPNFEEVSKCLVRLGLYKPRLENYKKEEQEEIIETILKNSSRTNWKSYYLQVSEHKGENREVFLKSNTLKKKIPDTIENINGRFVILNFSLFSLMGITWDESKDRPTVEELSKQLVELGFYKSKLGDYEKEEQEKIIKTIITSSNGRSASYYLQISEHKSENRPIFLGSDKLKEKLPRTIEDIDSKFISRDSGLLALMGITWEEGKDRPTVEETYKGLVELGFYKSKLEDYEKEEQEKIIKIIINNSKNKWKSYYFQISEYKDENRIVFAKSKLFRKKINCDNIEKINKKIVLSNFNLFLIMGITRKESKHKLTVKEISQWLVKLGFYKSKLEDYEKKEQEKIVETILMRSSEASWKSYYLQISNYKDKNKQIFLKSDTLKEKFPNIIEDIDSKLILQSFCFFTLMGITWDENRKQPTVEETYKGLVKLGFYKSKLSDYEKEEQDDIIKALLKKISGKGTPKSYYLQTSEHKDENKQIFLKSNTLKEKLPNNVENIDVKFIESRIGLFNLLGITFNKNRNKPNFEETTKGLVKLGFYKSKLSDYEKEEQEEIIRVILNNNSKSSYYLQISEHKDENKKIFKNSQLFKDYLRDSTKTKVQNFLRRFDLTDTVLQQKTKCSVLNAPWGDDCVNQLLNLYNENLSNFKEIIRTTNIAQEKFGRSKGAVLAKLNSLITTTRPISQKSNYEIFSKPISSFPNKISQYFQEINNYALLHQNKVLLDVFPILSYYYPYNKELNDESCYVLIIPIIFKGNSLSDYESFEQHIISRLFSKLIDFNSNEPTSTNSILQIKISKNSFQFGKTNCLVGIYLRRKFSYNVEMETTEILECIEFENDYKKEFKYWIFHED